MFLSVCDPVRAIELCRGLIEDHGQDATVVSGACDQRVPSSTFGFFVVSLRNAVIEQFQWRLLETFSKPSHLTRIQTRMSAKNLSYPMARFEEEQMAKTMYVTLTTIGFGDYLPHEPGSIEFWNIYVFVGLTFFAYILSLISESMESRIHLVDGSNADEDDECEEILDWEKCEDVNIPLVVAPDARSGQVGLEGLKWSQQDQQQTSTHSYEQQVPEMTEITTSGRQSEIQDNQDNQPQVSSQSVHFEDETSASGGSSVAGGEGGDMPPRASLTTTLQSQTDQLKNRPRRRGSVGRVLKVSAKERKQMLQAEYYATHGSPPNCCCAHISNSNEMESNEGSNHHEFQGDAVIAPNPPVTIKFVDMHGVSHQRKVKRSMAMPPTVEQPESMIGGMESATGLNISRLNDCDNGTPFQTQGYVYGTSGYQDILAQRRRGALLSNQESPPQQSSSNLQGDRGHYPEARASQGGRSDHEDHDGIGDMATIHDQGQGRGTQDYYLQTSALQHQPQIKFESPVASPRNAFEGIRSDSAPSGSGHSLAKQPQQRISSSSQGAMIQQESVQRQGEYAPKGILKISSSTGVNLGNNSARRANRNTSDTCEEIHDPITAGSWSFGLEHTRQSQFSDAVEVGDPPAPSLKGDAGHLQRDPFDSPGANVNDMRFPQKRDGIAPIAVAPDIGSTSEPTHALPCTTTAAALPNASLRYSSVTSDATVGTCDETRNPVTILSFEDEHSQYAFDFGD
ncbi:hypothetical protein BGZ58_004650 [Dissophora ornata]|nr:hypothetical protein BGZ58_004650 [Dissophora ornata]